MRVELLKVMVQPVFVVVTDSGVTEIATEAQVTAAEVWRDPAYMERFEEACKQIAARYIAENTPPPSSNGKRHRAPAPSRRRK